MGLKHPFTSAKADGTDATKVRASNWNADHVVVGGLDIPVETVTAPAANNTRVTAKNHAGRIMLAQKGPSGLDVTLQPSFARNKIAMLITPPNATPATAENLGVLTATGTSTARAVATTNIVTRRPRIGYVSTTTAGTGAGIHFTQAQFTLGTGTDGGFHFVCRFAATDAAMQTVARMFAGLSSNVAAPTNVEPSTLTNSIGIGKGAADTNLRLFYGGSAAQASIDLGANFPANTANVLYELQLFASPDNAAGNTVGYRVENLNTGNVASGTLTAATAGTQLPLNTTLLAPRAWRFNNTAAAAVAIDIATLYVETDL